MNLDADVPTPIPKVPIHPAPISRGSDSAPLSKQEQRRLRKEFAGSNSKLMFTKEEIEQNKQDIKDRRKARRAMATGAAQRRYNVKHEAKKREREQSSYPMQDFVYQPSAMAQGEVSHAKRRKTRLTD